ncbi:flagellin [Vibrio owensii]|uniref:Flagellin n=1 Tax=Vibrio owensii CAIM 1854 = LMG 25443 TaxID=1229493 RepID=A0A0C1YJJ3_9VIBR|nr:flagellin [Vibrio owensii]KIF45440.1 flagellin [Vibrio owensii CAIM 1854 = LMG 25443]
MTISIRSNVAAMNAQNSLNKASNKTQDSMSHLASGSRINSAKDDAAGLAISNRLAFQASGIDVATKNANDGISILQTAEGGMEESTNVLQRIRDLAIQSANGVNSRDERISLDKEAQALKDEMNRLSDTTRFGGRNLLNGTFGNETFQIGSSQGEAMTISIDSIRSDNQNMGGAVFTAGEGKDSSWVVSPDKADFNYSFTNDDGNKESHTINVKAGDSIEEVATYINGQSQEALKASVNEDGELQIYMDNNKIEKGVSFSGSLAEELDLSGDSAEIQTVADIDITTVGGAQKAIGIVDSAVEYVDSQRAELGAYQNRLAHNISNLNDIQVGVTESKGRIRDTDYAKETTEMTKNQIMSQAGTSILAQARQNPSSALSLLG